MAIDRVGNPVVTWIDSIPYFDNVYLKRWNGNNWEELNGSATKNGLFSNNNYFDNEIKLAINSNSNPVVICNHIEGTGRHDDFVTYTYLKKWNGIKWEELGSSASGKGAFSDFEYIDNPQVAIDSFNNVIVLLGSSPLCIKKWDGNDWKELGRLSTGTLVDTRFMSMKLNKSNNPVIAWTSPDSFKIHLFECKGFSFEYIGEPMVRVASDKRPFYSIEPSLVIDNSGYPIVAWTNDYIDMSNINDPRPVRYICIKKWNGNRWEEYGGVSIKRRYWIGAISFFIIK